jgi:hypothetical protein
VGETLRACIEGRGCAREGQFLEWDVPLALLPGSTSWPRTSSGWAPLNRDLTPDGIDSYVASAKWIDRVWRSIRL